ncbi:MAG: hypothetical protein DWQ34_10390 [Planctomycetota bacterium]|nr:MAG: hypothetical protein DWQ29_19995 [Planctomycetota bacterium]REJ93552.1 MAG: hypothetical protein DWQ34_10390 [Planctomycetota bacterium]REK21445.1 MAG: hypothetical protein DWQ41_21685 [Planctomycetota bacterium]REK40043.1 MAG: hypothetical protein DWQ45_00360 [Planctomycetota bacterium]
MVVTDDQSNRLQGIMAERKNTHGLSLTTHSNRTIVDIGDMEIWDGADLSLIRDTLTRLIEKERRKSVAIQMRSVKYVPSGFFGMLYDYFEQGVSIRLIRPQPRIANMLWFKRFFAPESGGSHVLCGDRRRETAAMALAGREAWEANSDSTELSHAKV